MDLVKQADYVYSVSYIRAIEMNLLSDSDFESMLLAADFDAAARVLIRKTLYEINMTDLIKEANLSKGWIYLYYKDIID